MTKKAKKHERTETYTFVTVVVYVVRLLRERGGRVEMFFLYRSVQLARLAVIICLENSTTFKCDFYIILLYRMGIMEFAFKQQSRNVPLKIH